MNQKYFSLDTIIKVKIISISISISLIKGLRKISDITILIIVTATIKTIQAKDIEQIYL